MGFLFLKAENLYAQIMPGSAQEIGVSTEPMQKSQGINPFYTPEELQADETVFHTTVFTFGEIVIFSYANDTEITIINAVGDTTTAVMLQENDYHIQLAASGVYRIFGSKSFTALVGDATTNDVNGWYAVDQSGRGTSTLFNTYMMTRRYGGEKFIVAAYENNTEFTIRNLTTGDLLYAGVLDAEEFFTMPTTPFDTFLQVEANKPVSALSYGDTDYYVPSSNGTFAGTMFLGYSAYIRNWTNSITVTGYYDDTHVVVTNAVTQDTLETYTLNEGEVNSIGITTPTYWKIESDKPVIAANIPYAGWTGNYAYLTRAVDKSGIGAGTLFYMPTIGSRIDVFSFEDDNQIKIERLGRDTDYPYSDTLLIHEGTLEAGEGYFFNSTSGRWVYKIQGTENISVIQSNSGFGAEFMPLSFAQELPDLAVSSDGILFDPEKDVYDQGEIIDVTILVHNYGPVDVGAVPVEVYDGDPDGEGVAPLLHREVLWLVEGNSYETVSFEYVVPNHPEFRQIVVKVDPDEEIQESNNANNKAFRFIQPNEDLLPPVAVTVRATGSLRLNDDLEPVPNPFNITATLLNTGEGDARNVEISLLPLDGLSIDTEPETLEFETLTPGESVSLDWFLTVDADSIGMNRYTILVTGDNVEPKEVNRAVNVPNPAPDPVKLETPEYDAKDVERTPTLVWSPANRAETYHLQVSDTDDFSELLYNVEDIEETEFEIEDSLEEGVTYFWRVRGKNFKGYGDWPALMKFTTTPPTYATSEELPSRVMLLQNYPNPFNPVTTIGYQLPVESPVLLEVYNMLGQKVATLVDEQVSAGHHNVIFDSESLSSGVYIYRLEAAGTVLSRRMTILK